MELSSIKKHLSVYSIDRRRRTTIHHAFASAIAPVDTYDENDVRRGLSLLDQDPSNLACTYCGNTAEGWDHLQPLVRKTRFSGHGHTLGNLVPTCHRCNSRKGNRDWKDWLASTGRADRIPPIERYVQAYASRFLALGQMIREHPHETRRLDEIKSTVLSLLREADEVAEKIRGVGTR